MDGTASAAADLSAQFTTPSWQKENWRTATQGWALARPPSPTRSTPDPRARGQGAYRVWEGKEGAVGNQEYQESVRRFARDMWSCDARRALGGVWRRHTRWAQTQGIEDRKSIAEKQVHEKSCKVVLSKRKRRNGSRAKLEVISDKLPTGPGRPSMLMLLN